ncbi:MULTISPECIES: efflux RND transporter periplasmic adaptor subunit [Rhodanobacter]|uniref:HlyD family secretion protein n=1 Tax=Rhodanobacter TaxID=75309 RepID=UPI00041E9F07|nr:MULTISPECIES: HlyD family efflux transporter periplasmic adaptor subunit [Rhodanobacter]KZC19901.1 hemolysin D [Rhodanobacter denitrificans]UJJ49686.1 efflux RND transporter periplasmic adaptor subunit [Rhodanobacter denitrificans]UJJ58121.1 efflux RND transporter periplasmic adaptor subunit [Rhodanobacter denitrificans]UJM92400.1 efflux RND transporter periplasmic adaptor subunit [Rhodanobacter denitrificans]UJM95929.1 efflux RND transporter periplasmic adaptor subunit [Rhodanobacter denit
MSATESAKTSADANDSGMAAKDPAKRRRTLLIVASVFILAALLWFLLWFFVLSTRVKTDNAYVGGNQVAISAQVPGTVVAILADDTQHVEAGQVLVKLDSTDADTRLAQARSALAQAVRGVRQQTSSATSADAQVVAAKLDLKKAEADLKRRLPLIAAQAESPEIVQHLRDGVEQARAAVNAAEAQAAAAHAAIEGTDVAQNPVVLQARANFRAAWVAAQRNAIYAPVSGYVAERSVQLGNSVQPGQQLMTVVPLHDLWIDANFKESQLRHIRIGQPAKIVSDLYGSDAVYHGKVVGLGAGTGSVFSLLPAQNATGNWIKVVQRVPVRIALDNQELDRHPLRIGLSTDVTVDIRHDQGSVLANAPTQQPVAQTGVYDQMASQADAEADRIIRANLSHATAAN